MRFITRAAIAAAGLLALTACQPPAQDTAADMAALNAVTQAWQSAYAAGNADAIAELYAEDALVAAPDRPAVVGRAAIREMVAADIAGAQAAGMTLNISESVGGVSGDLGWNSGTWTATDASGTVVDSGNYLSVSKKVDGKWLYIRDMWNSDQVKEAPEMDEMPAG